MKDFMLLLVAEVLAFWGGAYFIISMASCHNRACLLTIPKWLPIWW